MNSMSSFFSLCVSTFDWLIDILLGTDAVPCQAMTGLRVQVSCR